MAIIKVKTGGITADAITDALIADDVVGTEHLTANEVDTTALGADAVTGAQLADDAVNSEHYTDGSVDTAHIADAQITTAKLSTAVFTGATDIGADIADADLFLVDDGAGGTIRKTAASRLKTYVGSGLESVNAWYLDSNTTLTAGQDVVISSWSQKYNMAGSALTESGGSFTFPSTGIYRVACSLALYNAAGTFVPNVVVRLQTSSDSGSNWTIRANTQNFIGSDGSGNRWHQSHNEIDVDITNASNDRLRVICQAYTDDCNIENGGSTSYISFLKVAET